MVAVQALPFEHWCFPPTAQRCREEVDGGVVAIHCPPQGLSGVEYIVGVQVLPEGQWQFPPIVQGMMGTETTGGGVKQSPPHGWPNVQVSVGVHVHDVGHGSLFPTTQGMVNCGGGVVEGSLQNASEAKGKMFRRD